MENDELPEQDSIKAPWMTIRQACEHLQVAHDYINRRMIPLKGSPKRVPGKIRWAPLKDGGLRNQPRLVREDVYAILPLPGDVGGKT